MQLHSALVGKNEFTLYLVLVNLLLSCITPNYSFLCIFRAFLFSLKPEKRNHHRQTTCPDSYHQGSSIHTFCILSCWKVIAWWSLQNGFWLLSDVVKKTDLQKKSSCLTYKCIQISPSIWNRTKLKQWRLLWAALWLETDLIHTILTTTLIPNWLKNHAHYTTSVFRFQFLPTFSCLCIVLQPAGTGNKCHANTRVWAYMRMCYFLRARSVHESSCPVSCFEISRDTPLLQSFRA